MKSMWRQSNPVTAARMFQYRLVTDFVIRIEFQAQGSPHAHTLQWVKDAPKFG